MEKQVMQGSRGTTGSGVSDRAGIRHSIARRLDSAGLCYSQNVPTYIDLMSNSYTTADIYRYAYDTIR